MSINGRFTMTTGPLTPSQYQLAEQFLCTFDLNLRTIRSKKLHILDYPSGERAFKRLKDSFERLCEHENIFDIELTSSIEDEPAATLVFLFLADPKHLSTKVSHLTTYTSSEHPTIWILVKEKHHPRIREPIPSIWEPLTNAQYYEYLPVIKIANEKWIATRFTLGRQGTYDSKQDVTLPLSAQAQQRRSIV